MRRGSWGAPLAQGQGGPGLGAHGRAALGPRMLRPGTYDAQKPARHGQDCDAPKAREAQRQPPICYRPVADIASICVGLAQTIGKFARASRE